MTRTVLIDLDDTLLDNSMDIFLPAYFQQLGDYLSELIAPDRMLPALMAGTRAMLTNQDPTTTLVQKFSDIYYPDLGVDEASLGNRIHHFYKQVFPGLESLTGVRPDARSFIEHLFTSGYEVVIATNPLFPRLAIEARLRWANIPSDEFGYTLVTSYEGFHFTKPNPAYYAEILGLLGHSPVEAVMIGNDVSADLDPAHSLGMPVFHLQSNPIERYPGGDFEMARVWLESAGRTGNPAAANQPEIILARLKAHLGALLTLAERCSGSLWLRRPASGEWAPIEILAHFADVEGEVNLPRLQQFIQESEPHMTAFDTDIWAQERGYIDYFPEVTLNQFVASRLKLLKMLQLMEPEDWIKQGVHSLLGPTTLAEVMNIAVEHDLLHLAQMRTTIGFPP